MLCEILCLLTLAGLGRPLPQQDIPLLASLMTELMAVGIGTATLEDCDKATQLAESVAAAMRRPREPAATHVARSGGVGDETSEPASVDRQHELGVLEVEMQRAVAAERYEDAHALKQQIADLRLQLVQRRTDCAPQAGEAAELVKRYSGQNVVEIFKFTWDQTQQYVRVHVDLPAPAIEQQVSCSFDPDAAPDKKQAFALRVPCRDGRTYTLKRRLKHKIDPDAIGEVVGLINGKIHNGCRLDFPKSSRVTVHMTKFVEIISEDERQQMRELSEKGMMGPMGMMGGSGFGERSKVRTV